MATWFTKRECALVESAIRTVAEALDLDEDELVNALELPFVHPLDEIMRKHPSHNVDKCHILVDNIRNTQCSSARLQNGKFCKRHTKTQERVPDPTVVITFEVDRGLERFRKLKRESRFTRMQLMVRDDVDYLFDPLAGVYTHPLDELEGTDLPSPTIADM